MPSRLASPTTLPSLLSLLSCFCFAPTSALAQVRTEDRVAAESLFSEGRQLLLAGDYERACPKLEASRNLEPALGTWLNLADCYEKLGRFASAWAEFKSAAAAAQKAGDALRKEAALGRAAALEPRLSRLRLVVDDATASVLKNGAPVSPAVFGSAIPVDPGTYRIEAHAPNKATWSQSIEVQGERALVEVKVPALAEAGAPPAPLPPSEPPVMTDGAGSSQRTWAWVVGGAGVASLGVGTLFGALAASNWSKAEDSCNDPPFECSRAGLGDDASTQATIATVGFVVGAAALATSVVLFVTADDGPEPAGLAIGPGHVSWRGSF